ncbi:multidrug resistance protein fnx1 [Nannizzia gypsea CBS 118893]|uniref:Multidrug resistance protein fnx1 n=1 Tax=Arthroderma gypseum (strain ATCC MYA-4604 / CBS 118893) TaxID=535722 RepID=E4V369_ARTGP|nr:multidrug resistance protein fnx1 [Nannizzia gypsea CBS 118893]EFR04443.1 multidrug resistance protein fnx1 [Nannizzia gypsea CBS 118893]
MRTSHLADDDSRTPATETSPLLGARAVNDSLNGPSTAGVGAGNGQPKPDEETAGGNGIDDARIAQFKGVPELQKRLKYIVPAITIGVFLSSADQTIIVASYGKIGSDLNALNLTSWIATSYFLSLTAFQPLYGRLSDIFGRKACLLFGYTIFGTGCVLCGLAQNIKQLIAARVFQGIGGGGLSTVVSIIMSDIVPLRDRGVWQGVINIVWSAGSGLGAPLGGFLADTIGWRWAFLAQGPCCLLAFIVVGLTLKMPTTDQSNWKEKLKRVDFLGAFVLVIAVFGLILGLDRGGNVSWTMPLTIISLSISVVAFILFMAIEARFAVAPFAPLHITFGRDLVACYLTNFFSFGGWLAAIFYIPLFFQASDGSSAASAGIKLLPSILLGVSGSLFGGWLMKKTGKYYWITFYSYALLVAGLVVITLFSGVITKSTPLIIIGMTMCAFGNGIGVTTTLIALIANASPEDQAVATACSYLYRSLGSVITISLSASIVQQFLRSSLRSALKGNKNIDEIVDGVRQSLDYIKHLDPHLREVVRDCYGRSTTTAFGFMTILVFLAFISAVFIREQKLSA